ncbi:hypothetical protein Rsub_02602 [Raphidocelis subcapitata]|uniref:Uncharacterized protein n=1 Tax=Raphidocelis subcapitata TaxID=307507 RepID=A0A2V0NQF8_9CHLO|nr:hypothetical protein Rsub_02602 [Raphidocelis subcapitata]|eukprot:GBF89898.1 hypothetical protein Rsub_02602 [Raphidocelis subcapitata]
MDGPRARCSRRPGRPRHAAPLLLLALLLSGEAHPALAFSLDKVSLPIKIDQPLIDLESLATTAQQGINAVVGVVTTGIDNLISNVGFVFEGVGECLASLDKVRLKVQEQAVKDLQGTIGAMETAGMLPVDLIYAASEVAAPQLVKDPKPQLWRLLNPYECTWGVPKQPAHFQAITDPATQIPHNLVSHFFVHGAMYNGKPGYAYNNYYLAFEYRAKYFKSVPNRFWTCDNSTCAIYILTYDSDITDADEGIARQAIVTVLGSIAATVPVTGPAGFLAAAVIWRELKRRARIAGAYLRNVVATLPHGDAIEWGQGNFYIYSHSLGNQVVAHAFHTQYTASPNDGGRFRGWYAFAAAIPASSFAPIGGIYSKALLALNHHMRSWPYQGTVRIYSSLKDEALSVLYYVANGHFAMGQVGPRPPPDFVEGTGLVFNHRDTMSLTGTAHSPFASKMSIAKTGYFQKLVPMLLEDTVQAYNW